eukprot:CAMPEP_0185310184 /NCGR_PEP_ID=MMETSP1363-20130426/24136_1 /TAXON_ID=38817 /ORGANISM="Gephyrocapsa oceanica, Strain RCC1303" /LENGTH=202 /DNA_ID=CAMNT_0027907721 /DNA_START=17 /DNA_END=625 /DNA_ORIENTATION=+
MRSVLGICCALAAASASAPSADRRVQRRFPRLQLGLGRRRSDRSALAKAFMMSELKFTTDEPVEGTDLIQFRGKGDDYCAFMEPLTEQLCNELGVKIRCFEVWHDSRNLELLQRLDAGRCNGVPFFYNKRSKQFICGATTYENLKTWALGKTCEEFAPPPELEKLAREQQEGPMNKVQALMAEVTAKAKAMMDERQEKESAE